MPTAARGLDRGLVRRPQHPSPSSRALRGGGPDQRPWPAANQDFAGTGRADQHRCAEFRGRGWFLARLVPNTQMQPTGRGRPALRVGAVLLVAKVRKRRFVWRGLEGLQLICISLGSTH